MNTGFLDPAVATVPTACGIETEYDFNKRIHDLQVATVPTACGIETSKPLKESIVKLAERCNSTCRLRY